MCSWSDICGIDADESEYYEEGWPRRSSWTRKMPQLWTSDFEPNTYWQSNKVSRMCADIEGGKMIEYA